MRTISLRHLDNREFARITDPPLGSCAAVIEAVEREFECDEDAIRFDENEDGELIYVYDQPVAQSFVTYGSF